MKPYKKLFKEAIKGFDDPIPGAVNYSIEKNGMYYVYANHIRKGEGIPYSGPFETEREAKHEVERVEAVAAEIVREKELVERKKLINKINKWRKSIGARPIRDLETITINEFKALVPGDHVFTEGWYRNKSVYESYQLEEKVGGHEWLVVGSSHSRELTFDKRGPGYEKVIDIVKGSL